MSYWGYREPRSNAVLVLITITVVFFVLGMASPRLEALMALVPIAVPVRPWTLITNMFVHGGFGHIVGNMFTLYFFGTYLCGLVGQNRFLYVYFLGGLMGNIFYVLAAFFLFLNPFTPAVGASGAIFAVGGVLAVMRPKSPVVVFPIPAEIPLWVAVIGGFVILSFFPGVAWEAHLGGLLFGVVAGRYFRDQELRGRLRF